MKVLPRVVERELGRERALGQYHAHGGGLIEIDPRLPSRARLRVAVHEALHHAAAYLEEDAVDAAARAVENVLWKDGWRRSV